MPRESHKECVGRFSGARNAGSRPDTRMGESRANCSTPTNRTSASQRSFSNAACKVLKVEGRTDVVVVAVTQYDDIVQPPSFVQGSPTIVLDWRDLDVFTQARQLDVGLACLSPAASVQQDDCLCRRHEFGIDEGTFVECVIDLDN